VNTARPDLPLFPFHFRFIGFLLIIIGAVAGYLYYWGGKPAFFEVPVFAVLTSYIETRYFVVAQTNLLDEAAAVFILTGMIFIGFSKEKTEDQLINLLRIKALFYAIYVAAAAWIALFVLIFGWPIIIASSFVFLIFLLAFIFIFRFMILKVKYRLKKTKPINQVL
jgi:hypothetical protein